LDKVLRTFIVKTEERPYEKFYVSCDYGTKNPTTFGLWGFCGDIWYKVKEYHYDGRKKGRQKTDEQYCDDMAICARSKIINIMHIGSIRL